MRIRSRGRARTAAVVAAGLVLAVAAPAGAQPRSSGRTPPDQQIVTAFARQSSLTMTSGLSRYLFVGGSSADADISATTFRHIRDIGCRSHPSQGPVGPSSSDQGSFVTTGSVAAIAGVGLSGYTVTPVPFGYGATLYCGASASGFPASVTLPLTTSDTIGAREMLVVLVGTLGVGTLAPSLLAQSGGRCQLGGDGALSTLRNTTVSKGRDEGTAVAVFAATLQYPLTYCDFTAYGTSMNPPGDVGGSVSMWVNAYVLNPKLG